MCAATGTIDPYSTHQEALVFAALSTSGGILELGCGDYSTPILNQIANVQKKKFKIVSSNKVWLDKYQYVEDRELIKKWEDYVFEGSYGIVFLDNEQFTIDRLELIPKIFKITDTLVVHDADKISKLKNWNAYVFDKKITWFKKYLPHTAIIQK